MSGTEVRDSVYQLDRQLDECVDISNCKQGLWIAGVAD